MRRRYLKKDYTPLPVNKHLLLTLLFVFSFLLVTTVALESSYKHHLYEQQVLGTSSEE